MSGSDWTLTANYSLFKPVVNADNDNWGDHWNSNADTLDGLIHSIQTGSVTSFNTRVGAVTLTAADVTALGFATTTTNDGAYVNVSGDSMTGPLGLSGNAVSALQAVPLQQLNASVPAGSVTVPVMDSIGAAGIATAWSRGDHVHPTDTSRYAASNPNGYQTAAQVTTALAPYAPLASPALTGTPTAPNVTPSTDSTTKIANTAFVQSAVAALPAYAPIASPVFTGDPQAPTPSPGDNDTSVATTAFVTNAVAGVSALAGSHNVGRNLLHNPLFQVNQRGGGPFTTLGAYTSDRWFQNGALDAVNFGTVGLIDSDRAAIGDEAASLTLQNSFTGNAGASAYSFLVQYIEGVRRLTGKTATVSFWARSSTILKLGLNIYQSFGTGGSPSTGGWINATGQSVTLTTAWARFSVIFVIPSASGKTLGTNLNDSHGLSFFYSSGANNNAAAGNIGVQSGNIQLWGVQLEIGSVATPLEKPDPQQDLAKCQRFYQFIGGGGTGVYLSTFASASGNFGAGSLLFPAMRATPTATPATIAYAGTATAVSVTAHSVQSLSSTITQNAAGYALAAFDLALSADL